MRASRLAVGMIVVSVLVVAAASAPTAAQIEGTDQEEAEICGDAPAGNSLVLVLPGDTYVYPGGQRALLPGTTGELALCSDGELQTTPATWDVDEGSTTGLRVTSESDYGHTVTVEPVEASTSVGFGVTSDLGGSIESPTVTASPGRVMTVGVGGDTYRVSVNDGDRDRLRRANDSYTATLDGMRTAAADLDEDAGQLDPDPDVPDDRRLPQINQTRAVTTNYSTIQSLLFSAATSGNTEAVAALDAYERRHDDALGDTRDSLETANQAIEQQARSTALGVLGNLLGVALVGAVVGGIGGRVLTDRILSEVEIDRRRSSAVDFRPKHLAVQLGIAAVLVAGAVILVVTQGLLDPLVAVVRAVIGV